MTLQRAWPHAIVLAASALLVTAVGTFGMADAFGAVQVTVGQAFGTHAPSRSIPIPLVLWIVLLIYGIVVIRPRSRGSATLVAVLFVDALGVELARALVALRTSPLPADIVGAYTTYVLAAGVALLFALGATTTIILRRRAVPLLPIAVSGVVALVRLVIAVDPIGAAALTAGSAAAAVTSLAGRGPRALTELSRIRPEAVLAGVVLAGAAARLFMVTVLWRTHGLDYPTASDDGPNYDLLAWLMATGLFSDQDRTGFYFNVYVVLVAGIYAVFGHSFLALGAVQAALGASVVALGYRMARAVADHVTSLVAAIAIAGNTTLILLAAYIGTEAIMLPLLAGGTALLLAALRTAGVLRLAAVALAGLALGIGGVARDVMLGLPLFALVWIVWAFRARGLGSRATASLAIAFAVAAGAGYVPFSAYRERLTLATTYLVPTAYHLGHPELEAVGLDARTGVAGWLPVIASRPGDVAAAYLREIPPKLDMLLLSSSFTNFDPLFLVQRSDYARTLELYFLMATALGMKIMLADRRLPADARLLLLLLPAYGLLAHVLLFHANSAFRYRALYDPVFAIAFALGAAAIFRAARASLE